MLKYHIQTVELTSAQASISFNSIPQDYDDLIIMASLQNATGNEVFVRFNGDSGANYSWRRLQGSGTAAISDANTTYGAPYNSFFYFMYASTITSGGANIFGNGQLYIPNYSGNMVKSISSDAVNEINATNAYQAIVAGLWNNTSPITRISISGNGNYVAGSSISLYGVKRGSDGVVNSRPAYGGEITTSGGYTIHTFNTSGTFYTTRALQCEYLVIAGGAGGSTLAGGGGGAGGYRSSVAGESSGGGASAESTLTLPAYNSYAITVGSGGAGATTDGANGANGVSSTFTSITSIGGGQGVHLGANSTIGGSGGGAGYNSGSGGPGTTGQGFAGGSTSGGATAPNYPAAGGGGAGALGGNATTSNGGVGGVGVVSAITGTSIFRAGGGGGSFGTTGAAAGNGGGGVGGGIFSGVTPGNAVSNTGGGGGGGGAGTPKAGNGGSGVVIIRYLTP